jgi:rod shape-determining protein MreC
MTRLKDDSLKLVRGGVKAQRKAELRALFPILIAVSMGLLLLSRLNHSALANARWRLAETLSPVLEAAMVPLQPVRTIGRQIAAQVDMTSELERLKTENQKLSNWEWRARELERKLADLESLSRTVSAPVLDFVTSRVIADSSGAFVRSVMIDAGRGESVRTGFPVVNGDGLVGRVVETGAHTARVLLLTDLNSRIPVVIGNNNVRAIMAGDNGPEPRLIYQPQDSRISIGDEVATSGTGGLFPRGLRIGVVTGDAKAPRVKLRASLDGLEYVSILFFEDPSLGLLGEGEGGKSPSRLAVSPHPAKEQKR